MHFSYQKITAVNGHHKHQRHFARQLRIAVTEHIGRKPVSEVKRHPSEAATQQYIVSSSGSQHAPFTKLGKLRPSYTYGVGIDVGNRVSDVGQAHVLDLIDIEFVVYESYVYNHKGKQHQKRCLPSNCQTNNSRLHEGKPQYPSQMFPTVPASKHPLVLLLRVVLLHLAR